MCYTLNMARYLHNAHLNIVYVKDGQKVTRGQLIGRVGKSGLGRGGKAHLHFEVRRDLYGGVNWYPSWYHSRSWINSHYMNPGEYFAMPGILKPMQFSHLGYGYLSWTGRQYHPGWDLNWGAGDADFNKPVFATENGIVVDTLTSAGWGNHVIIEGHGVGITDETIKGLYRDIWHREPATGDWTYFRVRLDIGSISDYDDLVNKMKYTYAMWKEKGDRWWQNEKDKYLLKK